MCRRASNNSRTRSSNRPLFCCGAFGRDWHIASIRGNTALRSLSEQSGHLLSRAFGTRFRIPCPKVRRLRDRRADAGRSGRHPEGVRPAIARSAGHQADRSACAVDGERFPPPWSFAHSDACSAAIAQDLFRPGTLTFPADGRHRPPENFPARSTSGFLRIKLGGRFPYSGRWI